MWGSFDLLNGIHCVDGLCNRDWGLGSTPCSLNFSSLMILLIIYLYIYIQGHRTFVGQNHISRWKLTTIFQDIKNIQHHHQLKLTVKATPLQVIKDLKSMALTASTTFTDVYYKHPMFSNSTST